MKTSMFMILPAVMLAVAVAGCNATATRYHYRPMAHGPNLVETTLPMPIQTNGDRGVSLPLGNRLSLNIDVECILDYVQGESETIKNQPLLQEHLNPWLRFSMNF